MCIILFMLFVFLYVCIGALVSFALYRLHNLHETFGDLSEYCVAVGVFWPVAAPFAFAVYFAKFGIPKGDKKKK